MRHPWWYGRLAGDVGGQHPGGSHGGFGLNMALLGGTEEGQGLGQSQQRLHKPGEIGCLARAGTAEREQNPRPCPDGFSGRSGVRGGRPPGPGRPGNALTGRVHRPIVWPV